MRPSIALPSLLLASLLLAPALALGDTPAPVPLAGGPTKPPALKVEIDRAKRTATFTVQGPKGAQPQDIAAIEAAGAS